MPTPLFTVTDFLIINQPCNYTAEQKEGGRERSRDTGDMERESEYKTSIVGEQERKERHEER